MATSYAEDNIRQTYVECTGTIQALRADEEHRDNDSDGGKEEDNRDDDE